jgi:hypothetical protein
MVPYIMACHLKIDADPDPAYHFDAHPDPACHFDADPDPQHCEKKELANLPVIINITYGFIHIIADIYLNRDITLHRLFSVKGSVNDNKGE